MMIFSKKLYWKLLQLVIMIAVATIAFFVLWFLGQAIIYYTESTQISSPQEIILFYGVDCTHCKAVEDFIIKNDIESKITFTRKEVFYNFFNRTLLQNKADICKLDESHLGVPFLWDGEHCIVGDVDIINFFRERLKRK